MTEEELYNEIPEKMKRIISKVPIVLDWCEFKGEVVVAQLNYERTEKAKKPMFDISYCMTKALNQVVLETVQYDKKKFKPCHLTAHWGAIQLTTT